MKFHGKNMHTSRISIPSLNRFLTIGFKSKAHYDRRAFMEKNNIAAPRYSFLRNYHKHFTSYLKKVVLCVIRRQNMCIVNEVFKTRNT